MVIAKSVPGQPAKLVQLIVVSFVFLLCTNAYALRNIQPGEKVPAFKLAGIDGKTYRLSDLHTRPLILSYIRAGQDRSREALRDMVQYYDTSNNGRFGFVAITKDTKRISELKKLAGELKLPFPLLLDEEGDVYKKMGVFVFPTTIVINSKGAMHFSYSGYRDDFMQEIEGQARVAAGAITPEQLAAEKTKQHTGLEENQRKAVHHINLGRRLQGTGMYQKAYEEFQQAVELDPENADAHTEIGYHLLDENEVAGALKHFEQAAALNPRDSGAKIGIGKALRLQGKPDKALDVLQSALLLCPDAALVHFEIAKIHEDKGNKDEALNHYRESAVCCMGFSKKR